MKSGFFGATYVRLYGIGVTNVHEDLGARAKATTEKLTSVGEVVCTVYNKEGKYRVSVVRNSENRDVNYELIALGYAWTTTDEFKTWNQAQKAAQKADRGVWKTMKIENGKLVEKKDDKTK
jgi:endonuclease YncB( thermonuclease family)